MSAADIMQIPFPSAGARAPGHDEAGDLECRQTVESFIDEIAEQSFPASDPPAWGTAYLAVGAGGVVSTERA